MLVNKGKEAFSYVCFHVITVWRVVPYDVSLSAFPDGWMDGWMDGFFYLYTKSYEI